MIEVREKHIEKNVYHPEQEILVHNGGTLRKLGLEDQVARREIKSRILSTTTTTTTTTKALEPPPQREETIQIEEVTTIAQEQPEIPSIASPVDESAQATTTTTTVNDSTRGKNRKGIDCEK